MKAFLSSVLDWPISLSGHSPALVTRLPESERIRIEALGMTLLLPVCISALGAGAAVYQISGENVRAAQAAGIAIGLFTLIIDRALLATPASRIGPVLLRIVLTLVTSTVFAHTALLWLFEEKIEEEARNARVEEATDLTRRMEALDLNQVAAKEAESRMLAEQIRELSEEQARTSELIAARQEKLDSYRKQYDDEINGRGASRLAGEGPASRRIQAELITPTANELAVLKETRGSQLATLNDLRQSLRSLSEAKTAETTTDLQINQLREESLSREYQGILTRFVLLHEIIRRDRAALTAYLLICTLLLLWELLPVFLKLSSGKCEYATEMRRQQNQFPGRSEIRERHQSRMELIKLEELEMEKWSELIESRFESIQEKRSAIPKRATAEQREAYLSLLDMSLRSLVRAGNCLENLSDAPK